MDLSPVGPERSLWIAVVLQARDDILSLAPEDLDYAEAVSFFTSTFGNWQKSRGDIADQLDLHSDDLVRLGRSAIAASRQKHGFSPLPDPDNSAQKEPIVPRSDDHQRAVLRRLTSARPQPAPMPVHAPAASRATQRTAADREQMQRFIQADPTLAPKMDPHAP